LSVFRDVHSVAAASLGILNEQLDRVMIAHSLGLKRQQTTYVSLTNSYHLNSLPLHVTYFCESFESDSMKTFYCHHLVPSNIN